MTRDDVISTFSRHVAERFGGDYRACFDETDADKDGEISHQELKDRLGLAGIVWFQSRVATAIMDELDKNGSGGIAWQEFSEVFNKPE